VSREWTDELLAAARDCAREGAEGHALRRYRKLDELLSSGQGALPRAWADAPKVEPVDLWREVSA
jgi:hypothetical protein